MGHTAHHRGHRRHGRSADVVRWLVAGSFAVLGGAFMLAMYFTPAPVALWLLLCGLALPLLVAFAVVSCVTGRATAMLTNLVRLCLGYASLEKAAEEARHARDPHPIPPKGAV